MSYREYHLLTIELVNRKNTKINKCIAASASESIIINLKDNIVASINTFTISK